MLGGRICRWLEQSSYPFLVATRPVRFVARDRGRRESPERDRISKQWKASTFFGASPPFAGRRMRRRAGRRRQRREGHHPSQCPLARSRDNGCSACSKRRETRRVSLLETVPAHTFFRSVVRKQGDVLHPIGFDRERDARGLRRWFVGSYDASYERRELRFFSRRRGSQGQRYSHEVRVLTRCARASK